MKLALKVCQRNYVFGLNNHLCVSHEMNLKCMATISHMTNITGLTVSIYKITYRIDLLINHVSAVEDMLSDPFHALSLVVSDQIYILTRGYAITYDETNR